MNNRYFLMRHGESEANLADKIISSPEQGCQAYGLSPLGQQQAEENARASGLGPETRILCSDFLRTRQTAEIAARVLGCPPPRLEVRLRERFFGAWEGSSARNYEPVWLQDESGQTQPGVESAQDLTARLAALVEELEKEPGEHCFLLVSHGDPLRFLQIWALARPTTAHQSLPHFRPAEIRPLR
ncbi:histidine phosphatase family protein [bacterium]|nr:histidine phosphatase family protein [bacterium]